VGAILEIAIAVALQRPGSVGNALERGFNQCGIDQRFET
jgi:hypothetical protein